MTKDTKTTGHHAITSTLEKATNSQLSFSINNILQLQTNGSATNHTIKNLSKINENTENTQENDSKAIAGK